MMQPLPISTYCLFPTFFFFFFNDTATTEIYTLSLHDALPISVGDGVRDDEVDQRRRAGVVEAVQELPVIQAELLAELGPVPGHHAGPGPEIAGLKGQREHGHQWYQEQGKQPQSGGQAQEVRREYLGEPGPRAAGGYAPCGIGKNRLFHAVSSSWLLYR